MNALYLWLSQRSLVIGPLAESLVRITIVLAIAWLAHAALWRANPRWRVLTWRMAAIAVLLVPALAFWAPAFQVRILPVEPAAPRSDPTATSPEIASSPQLDPQVRKTPQDFVAEGPPVSASLSPVATTIANNLPPTSANEPLPPSQPVDWLRLALTLWACGVVVGLVAEAAAWLRLHRLRRRSQSASPEIISLGRAIAARLGNSHLFEIRMTQELNSPCVCGALRPVIFLTETDGQPQHHGALSAILAHELAHAMHGDLRWNALWRLLTRLLWFHPLIWRARLAHLAACDAVCDATAATSLGDVSRYGQVLAQLALRLAPAKNATALHMARPSSVRRRIEAIHRRLYSARLSRRAVAAAIASALLLAGLCATLSITRVLAQATEVQRLAVSGRIVGEQGKPIAGATVYVYSAGVRVGTSPYCPTCYADCGKRAVTDADGRFSIASLDSSLIFRLLAVAKGHRPQFIERVDPQKRSSVEAKLAARETPQDRSRVVRGLVIDPFGNPAVGAIVTPFGCKTADRRWWGQMDGVDPLVVTNERGEFAVVCDKPVIGLDLQVEARAAARKNFELVESGNEIHRLQLELGASVKGRVLSQGRPVSGISIGICQTDRSGGTFLGAYDVGTDEQGRFSLSNLPADGDLFVYGLMKSMKDGQALPAKKITPKKDGTTDIGDVSVVPAHTLAGRIALSDGKALPPRTRVVISRDGAWDSGTVEAADDGTFSISGVPPEVVTVTARVAGYRLSAKNRSFELLNGFSLKGLVSGDIEGLTILYEPGEIGALIRPNRVNRADLQAVHAKYQRLSTQPLAGVTSSLEEFPQEAVAVDPGKPAPKPLPKIDLPPKEPSLPPVNAEGPRITLTGIVTDSNAKNADKAQVWLQVRWLNPLETLTATDTPNGSDPFRLSFPEAWLPENPNHRRPTVWAYVPGHAIGTANAHEHLFGNKLGEPFKMSVPPAENLSFVVLLPDGKPAVGAKVQPWHFKTFQGYDIVPRQLAERVAGTTDAAGRVAMPALTRDALHNIDVKLAGYGTQRFRCDMKSTTPSEQTLRLRPVGRIEGRIAVDQLELTRDMFVTVETEERTADMRAATGVAMLKVDDSGRFVIPEIAEGRVTVSTACDERLPVRPRLPSGPIWLLASETSQVEIPLEMAVRVHGGVRASDTGKPLSGVTAHVSYGEGRQSDQAVTDENGKYSALALPGKVYIQLISLPNGYQQLGEPWLDQRTVSADTKEYEWPTIDVVRSFQVVGKLIDADGKPMRKVRINGVQGNRRYGFGDTNEKGEFTLDRVPKEIELEKFEIWTRDERFEGVAQTKDPLVVRLEKK